MHLPAILSNTMYSYLALKSITIYLSRCYIY